MQTKIVVRAVKLAIGSKNIHFLLVFWDLILIQIINIKIYISQKIVNLNTTNKIHLKYDVIDGSEMNSFSQPAPFSFIFKKPSGFKSLKQLYLKKTINLY